jgi:hypothetical protein
MSNPNPDHIRPTTRRPPTDFADRASNSEASRTASVLSATQARISVRRPSRVEARSSLMHPRLASNRRRNRPLYAPAFDEL